MATVSIVIKTSKDPNEFKKSGQPQMNMTKLINLLSGLNVGALQGSIDVYAASADPVKASATATLTSVAVDNTITIAGTTLTAKASPANEDQFSQAGDDAADAASLAAVINAHSVLSKIVSATSSSNVVTISCVVPGPIGNLVTVSRVGAPIVLSGSALAGGAGGVASSPETIGK